MLIISIEMTFGKHIKNSVETTLWESVFYTNILSVIPMMLWATIMGEYKVLLPEHFNLYYALFFMIFSSCVAVGIGMTTHFIYSYKSDRSICVQGRVKGVVFIKISTLLLSLQLE